MEKYHNPQKAEGESILTCAVNDTYINTSMYNRICLDVFLLLQRYTVKPVIIGHLWDKQKVAL